MKIFVILAVVISLVSVQVSSNVLFRGIPDNGRETEGFLNKCMKQCRHGKWTDYSCPHTLSYHAKIWSYRIRTMSKNILTLTDDNIPPGNNDDYISSIVGDRGEIISGNIQEELQNIETLEDVVRFLLGNKGLQDCQGNTCNVCYLGLCLNLVYQAGSKQFQVSLKYNSITIFSLTLPAKDYQYCKQISIGFITGNVCLKISNVRIADSQACLDVTISALAFSKTFSNLCM